MRWVMTSERHRLFNRRFRIRLARRERNGKSWRQPLHDRYLVAQFSTQRALPGPHRTRQMRGVLHTSPFTKRKQVHLVQPFVHRIAERTVEVAIEGVGGRHTLTRSPIIVIQLPTKYHKFPWPLTIFVITLEPGIRSKRYGM